MDPRLEASLFAALISTALAVNVLLRPDKRKVHAAFVAFALNVAAWYVSAFLRRLAETPTFVRMHLACGIAVAFFAIQFFRAFVDERDRRMDALHRLAGVTGIAVIGAIASPLYVHPIVPSAVVGYLLLSFYAALVLLHRRGSRTRSRFEAARLRYLTIVGALGGVFTLVDYVPYYAGLEVPPLGTVFLVGFLYMLSQSVTRDRVIDLYELTGRLGVLTALAALLAAALFLLGSIAGQSSFVHFFVASLVVLVLFEPLRTKVEEWMSQFFFLERHLLEKTLVALRRQVAGTLDVTEMAHLVLLSLERSRRVTHASVYIADGDRSGYRLVGHLGPSPPARVAAAPARPLLDRLLREGALVLEELERELEQSRRRGQDREAETAYEVVQTLEALHGSICLAIAGADSELYGFLVLRDDRVRDAFSPDEVQLLVGLAAQAAICVENSQLYHAMKERDRLAALGEMAAGLAHEIRNPLGAIKASAQYLVEPGSETSAADREFLDIIVEETDRLNRVVGSFLDYARPSRGHEAPTDVAMLVERTMQLLGPELGTSGTRLSLECDRDVPKVRIDPEKLRQVLWNLARNAVEAMGEAGTLTVRLRTHDAGRGDATRTWVELAVQDTGPGIAHELLANLFVPFVTTKERGTGLGLAISQRIVTAAGGHIDVRTEIGKGSVFTVRLPAVDNAARARESAA